MDTKATTFRAARWQTAIATLLLSSMAATLVGLDAERLDRTIAAGQPATFPFTTLGRGYSVVVRAWAAAGADAPPRLEAIRHQIGTAAPTTIPGTRSLSLVLPRAIDSATPPGRTWGELKILYR